MAGKLVLFLVGNVARSAATSPIGSGEMVGKIVGSPTKRFIATMLPSCAFLAAPLNGTNAAVTETMRSSLFTSAIASGVLAF